MSSFRPPLDGGRRESPRSVALGETMYPWRPGLVGYRMFLGRPREAAAATPSGLVDAPPEAPDAASDSDAAPPEVGRAGQIPPGVCGEEPADMVGARSLAT